MQILIVKENFKDMDKLNKLAKEAFLPEEYLPPDYIVKMEDFKLYALYDNNLFVCLMAIKTLKNMAYLFYLAIDSNYRSKGYGKQALEEFKKLNENFQLTLDIELIDKKAKNNEQRIKRKNFYIKNGYKETGKGIYYFGVYYEILCNEDNINFELFKELMEDIKIPDFNPTFLIYNLRYKFNKMFHMKHLKFTTKL